MTAYIEDTGEKLSDGSTVPSGRVLEVTRVNGTQINRTNGFPVSVALPKGTLRIFRDGVVRYEDEGIIAGHPALAATITNGSITVTLGYPVLNADGEVSALIETTTETWTVSLTGVVADTTAPVLVGLNPANGSIDAPRNTLVTLTFSKPIEFGTGLITLRNVTGAVDIEAFDVVTEVGTGLGQVSLTGTEVKLRPSAALPASSVVSVRVAATAIKDLAGNSFAGIVTDAQSFTTAAAAPVSTASFYFGALTPSGQAGIPAASFSDASGHFQFAAGRIVVSAAGDTANLSGSPYAVTINGAAATIFAVPNAISVSTLAQAKAAAASFQATPTIDSTILMRDGDDWPWAGTLHDSLTTAAMSGVFADANSSGFATTATHITYNQDAVATLTGGTITVRPDTPLGATIRCRFQTHSEGKIIFDSVAFESVSLEDGRNMTEGLPSVTNANVIPTTATVFLVRAGSGAALPTGTALFKNCRFGGTPYGTPTTRFGSYVQAGSIGHLVVEDCSFDGYFNGLNGAGSRHFVARRVSSQRKIGDFSRCFGTLSATTGGVGVPVYYELIKTTDWNLVGSVNNDGGFHWGAYHSDYSQCGTALDQVDVAMLSAYNIHFAEMDRSDPTARIQAYYNGTLGRPDFTGIDFSTYPRRRAQGNFANYLSSGKRRFGTVYKDAYVCNCRNGYTNGGTDRMNIIKCLVLPGMGNFDDQLTATSSSDDRYRISPGTGLDNVVQDSIYFRVTASTGYVLTNNAQLVLTPTGPLSYGTNLAGAFGAGAFGPQIAFDTANGEATFRADFIAKMASRAGSLAAGKGPWS